MEKIISFLKWIDDPVNVFVIVAVICIGLVIADFLGIIGPIGFINQP